MKSIYLMPLLLLASCCNDVENQGNPITGEENYNVVDTRQSLCFDASEMIDAPTKGIAFYGQDAQYEGNMPSYTNNEDGTVTDNVTGLMWEKGYVVMGYEKAMELLNGYEYAGYTDWRLPTNKEAYSLMMFDGTDYYPDGDLTLKPFIDTDYFDFEYGANGHRPIDAQLLTSTMYTSKESYQLMFGVNFADGRIKGYEIEMHNQPKQFMVRFVRGAKYGENDFVDNGNGTISDNATGLMWSKRDNGEAINWEQALAYAAKMNAEKYLGYDDWRVPNAKELHTIVDYTRCPSSTSSAAINPMFECTSFMNENGDVDYPFYWSSTTHMLPKSTGAGERAVYIAFGRALGNMPDMSMMGAPGEGGKGMGQGDSGHTPPMQMLGSTGEANWIDIHGAGAQRSDPKDGDPSDYSDGHGPQGDVIRIFNYVRIVRGN